MSLTHPVAGPGSAGSELKVRILDRTARVAVIGVGYVGLPLAVEKAKVGFTVVGIDENPNRVHSLNAGISYIGDVKGEELSSLVTGKKLRATSDFQVLGSTDVAIICVPTPLTINRDPDVSFIANVTDKIALYLHPGQLVVLESTTYPGTTEEVILPRLEATGLKVGREFFLAHSPERVDPGNKRYTTKNTSKVVGGVTPACLDMAVTFYQQTIVDVVPVSSARVAEMVKVFENTYRAVNIALVNEVALLCDRMGINVWEMLDAAFTKPFGIQPFYPGPGVGGHCIPIDPFYLTWKAREYDFSTRFIELAGEINLRMPYFVVEKIARALGEHGKPVRGAQILVLGVAYKKDVADERESPALKVMELLAKEGAAVRYYDPLVPQVKPHGFVKAPLSSVPLTGDLLAASDAVVIATDHSCFDYREIVRCARLVVDTRNATKFVAEGREKIALL
ncbi:MAG: nucleotide sugar dehydrogenase [Deinococcus sp.]|nr:nucleotide sugar dehydrogenase [Deinococcus sp.]